jgi:hypothetical protein
VVALACVLATGALLAATAPPRDGWALLLPLGDGDPRAAVARADEVDRFLAAVLGRFELDRRTARFVEWLRRHLFDLDLGRLYAEFPGDSPDLATALRRRETRTLRIRGVNHGGARYALTFFPTGDEPAGADLGRLRGHIALQPWTVKAVAGPGYRAELDAEVGMSGMRYEQLGALAEAWFAELERAARSDPGAEALAAARALQPGLRREAELALLAQAQRAMPAATAFVSRYLTLDSAVRLVEPGDGPGWLEVDLMMHLHQDALKRDFPALHDWVEDLVDLFALHGAIETAGGRALLRYTIDTHGGLSARVRVCLHDGALLPVDAGGVPVHAEGLRLGELTNLNYGAWLRGRLEHLGLEVTLRDYPLGVSFRAGDGRARFTTRMHEPPEVEYGGRFLHVVPLWAVDAVIPKDIDRHTREFLAAVAHGPDGRGSRLELQYVNGERDGAGEGGGGARLHGRVETAAMDNGLVTFALGVMGRRLQPDDDALADAERLRRRFYEELSADYRAARPRVLAMTPRGEEGAAPPRVDRARE